MSTAQSPKIAADPRKTKQRAHFAWQEMVAARTDISPLHKIIAWALALHRNMNSDRCDPSYRGLAKAAGASESSAKRAIAEFERLGLIAVERTPGGAHDERNRYRLLMPAEGVSAVTPQGVSEKAPAGVSKRTRRGVSGRAEGCQSFDTQTGRTRWEASKDASPTRERETCAGAHDDSSPGGGAPLTGGPAEEVSPAAPPPARQDSPIERSRSVARKESGDEKFRELRAIWARPWADDDAADRRAFEVACREVAPEDIIEAAAAWVAAADAPRFLPPLAKWLAARGWEKPPPTKARASGNGTRPRYGRKPNLAEIGLDLVRKYEAERAAS
jgi:DNA-binding transcriptional regulator YhcF (GntR family)